MLAQTPIIVAHAEQIAEIVAKERDAVMGNAPIRIQILSTAVNVLNNVIRDSDVVAVNV